MTGIHNWKKIELEMDRQGQGGMVVKNPPANAGGTRDMGSVLRLGRSHLVGNGYFLQYSCLENSLDRETWQATVHEVTESDMTDLCAHTHTHTSVVKEGRKRFIVLFIRSVLKSL